VTRFAITLPQGQRLAGLNQTALALSPDGSQLAYVASTQDGTQEIYLRAMDSTEIKPVPGTEGAVIPFFSPDGQWLGFFADGKMKKVSVNGGVAVNLADALFPGGASWSKEGKILFTPILGASSIYEVSDAGGAVRPLTRLDKEESAHRWPEYLPDGKAVLFEAPSGRAGVGAQVVIESLAAGERRNLMAGMEPHYAPSGHLIYVLGGSLMAVPFDPRRLTVTGPAVSVLGAVFVSSTYAAAGQYTFSNTGSLAYVPGGVQPVLESKLVWVTRSGAEQPLAAAVRGYAYPKISPDGGRVALTVGTQQDSQLWLYDLVRGTLSRLTFEGNTNFGPVWTPDGRRIAFRSNKEGQLNAWWQLADGSGGLERLASSENLQAPLSWSPDGQLLAYVEMAPTTQQDIWVLRMGSSSPGQGRKAQLFLGTPFNEDAPQFSPDGHWLAYTSDESGRNEVYVQPYPGPAGKWQISTDGGTEPVWNHNGQELFYRSGDKMMAVDVATQPSFVAGKPRMLFQRQYVANLPPGAFPFYDVSPDGQRFLMLKPVEQSQAGPTQINVVLNWFEELKRRVPTGK
jgi:serine/threonine-protein kinase